MPLSNSMLHGADIANISNLNTLCFFGTAFKGEKDVVIAKVDADAHKQIAGEFDVTGFPTLKFFSKGTPAKVSKGEVYNGGRTADDLVTFMNGKAGSRARIKKAATNVADLTSSNFDSVVVNSDNDVMVEFYAPWCGHCKRLAPDYEKVATAFAGDKSIVVAKVDCDANPSLATKYGVTGFPTLKWFARGVKENPESYDGGREPQGFVDFINQKTGTLRNPDGSLKDEAGHVAELDALAAQFFASKSASVLSKAEKEVASLPANRKPWGETYIKLMKSIEKKGSDFVAQETTRVSRMLEGSLTAEKRDELQLRKNILTAFSSS